MTGVGPPGAVRVAVVVLAVTALAGCSGLPLPFGQEAAEPMDAVPGDVDYVGHVDYAAYRQQSPEVRATARDALSFQSRVVVYDGPAFLDALAFENDTGLDRDAVRSVTYFGRQNGSYGARVVRADWETGDVVAAVEARRDVTMTEDSHADRALYVAGNGSVAVADLPEGYAVGDPAAVRDAVDVAAGEADPVSGELRAAVERESGYVRYAFRFDPGKVPDVTLVDTEGFEAIRLVSAGYHADGAAGGTAADGGNGTRMGVAFNLTAADGTGADRVRSLLNSGLAIYRTQVAGPALSRELERVELDRRDRRVVVTYESTPEGFRTLLAGLRDDPEANGVSGEAGPWDR